MSYVKRFLEDLVTEYQRKHPSVSWEEAMDVVCHSENPIEEIKPKGYHTAFGYMGWNGKKYIPFATEREYDESLKEEGVVIV